MGRISKMAVERTLVILKPETLVQKLEFEILDRFRNAGFSIPMLYKTTPSEVALREHYSEVIEKKGENIANRLVYQMTSGPSIVAVVEGEQAVESVRSLVGRETEPIRCQPGTVRWDYSKDSYELADAEDRAVRNFVHVADSRGSVGKEIDLWFNKYLGTPLTGTAGNVYEDISLTIGCNLADFIKDLIEKSNEKRILYHGIKKGSEIEKVVKEGISPLTPESGPCSFWSTGIALFEPKIDSPFFNYSGGLHQPDTTGLNLAMTSYDLLSGVVPEYKGDAQITLKDYVPCASIAILDVKVRHPLKESHVELRRCRQVAEQILLTAIGAQVYAGLTPGRVIGYNKDLIS